MDWVFAIGAAVGLGVAAGLRAFVPLAVVAALALADLVVTLDGTDEAFAGRSWFLVVAVVLAVGEIALEKAPPGRLPPRAVDAVRVAGAVLLGVLAGADHGVPVVVTGILGGLAGVVGVLARDGLRPAGVDAGVRTTLSFSEDLASAVIGGVSAVLGPVGFAVLAAAAYVVVRLRRRRDKTYSGLRVLR